MKKVIVPAFQIVIAGGLTKVTGHQKCVHVLVEPSPKMQKYICSRQYLRVNTRGTRLAVVLQNVSGRDIILEPHTEVGMVTAANIVPSVQIPDEQDLKEN